MLANALYEQGRYAEATQFLQVAETVKTGDDFRGDAAHLGLRGKLTAREGDSATAEMLAREAVRLVAATDFVNDQADRLTDLGEVLRVAARHDEAVSVLNKALSFYEQKGNLASAAKARGLLDDVRAGASS
jgi:tetratricopeptide (TPR) repeat protein